MEFNGYEIGPGAYLRDADLSDADLEEAILNSATLVRANLIRANLVEASLVGANLSNATLMGADLKWANLDAANLSGTNLQNANLLGAESTRRLCAFFMPTGRLATAEGAMRVMGTGHQEKRLLRRLGHLVEPRGESSVDGRVAAPAILIARALPPVGDRPPKQLLLAERLADRAAEISCLVEKGRQGCGTRTNPLESLDSVVL